MADAKPTYTADVALETLNKLFGPTPLLRNESRDGFKEIFAKFFDALQPEDFLVEVLVYHLAIETCREFRLMRQEVTMLERSEKVRRHEKARVEMNLIIGMNTAKLDAKYRDEDDHSKYKQEHDELTAAANLTYKQRLKAAPTDEDYALASPKINDFTDGIELRRNRSRKRSEEILRQIATCRLPLSKRLRKISNDIIEAAVIQIEQKTSQLSAIGRLAVEDQSKQNVD